MICKNSRKIFFYILYTACGILTFFFGMILVFLSYPALSVFPLAFGLKETITGLGLIIPTLLSCWLISLLRKERSKKAFIPSLWIGAVIVSLVLISKLYLSWLPNDWLIFMPQGLVLIIISAFLGTAFFIRGRILVYISLIFFLLYSFSSGLTFYLNKVSSPILSCDVKIPSEDFFLGATLTLPKNNSSLKIPGIVLIPGSGKQDRDETFGLFNATFKEIAYFLTKNGFVVIRYDKRGVGRSGGDYTSASLYEFALDAESVFSYLKSRKEVDSSKIFLIGHSYGGKVATIVASRHPETEGLILLACVASSEPDNLIRQNRFISEVRKESESERKARFKSLNHWFEKVRSLEYRDYKDYFGPEGLARELQKIQKFNPLPPQWLRQAMEYNQLETLATLKMPILVISGTSDWMVPPSETKLVQSALEKAFHPDFEVIIFSDIDHHFTRVESAEKSYKIMSLTSIMDFFKVKPIDPDVLNKILDWLKIKIDK